MVRRVIATRPSASQCRGIFLSLRPTVSIWLHVAWLQHLRHLSATTPLRISRKRKEGGGRDFIPALSVIGVLRGGSELERDAFYAARSMSGFCDLFSQHARLVDAMAFAVLMAFISTLLLSLIVSVHPLRKPTFRQRPPRTARATWRAFRVGGRLEI